MNSVLFASKTPSQLFGKVAFKGNDLHVTSWWISVHSSMSGQNLRTRCLDKCSVQPSIIVHDCFKIDMYVQCGNRLLSSTMIPSMSYKKKQLRLIG
jgi:hypothetical protein